MIWQLEPIQSKIRWKKSQKLDLPTQMADDCDDLKRCLDFYKNVFGFDMVELMDAMDSDAGGFIEFGNKLFGFPYWFQVC